MKIYLAHISFTFLMLFLVGSLQAQQIFPVHVNGVLIPPHSLTLSDYNFDRAQDIMFFLNLQDPVERNRRVKLRFTVLHNGTEILTTDPNYNPPPITLDKDIPLMIDGTDLAGYLNQKNLVNLAGQPGSVLLPEGFNAFCLEVIDLERNVPISDRICVSGFFELSDPPLLNTPICNEILPWLGTQNLIFNWLPQHLSSINPPLDVQYEFKLIEVLPGQNPNDAFLFSAPIFEQTVFTPSLLYLEDAPLLEPDVIYAWRVRAFDGQNKNLFSNDGYSEVCTFSFRDENVVDPNTAYTCSSGLCDWPGEITQIPLSGGLNVGDELKINHFTLKLTAIQTAGVDRYQGEGTIYVPFLSSKLKVAFSDIKVNDKNRVYAGDVYTVAGDQSALIPPLFDIADPGLIGDLTNLDIGFPDASAQALMTYFSNTDASPNLISLLEGNTEESAVPINVPIGIDKGVENPDFLSSTIVITGIRFSPLKAALNAVMASRQNENSSWVKFGVKNLCVQPGGLTQSETPKLELLTDTDLSKQGLTVKLLGRKDGQDNSYLSWNCQGVEQFELKGQIEFDREFIVPDDDPAGTVTGTFTTSADRLFDFIAPVGEVGDFVVKGTENLAMRVEDQVWIDFSETENPIGLTFPPGYPAETANLKFQGVWFSQSGTDIPAVIQNSSSQALANLLTGSMLYDQNGISGLLSEKDLISLENGSLGGWPYSVDSLQLILQANELIAADFQGKLRLPIMNETEFLPYKASFPIGIGTPPTNYILKADSDLPVEIRLFRASIHFDENSEISVGLADEKFLSPKADLNGQMTFNINQADPGFAITEPIQSDYEALQATYESMGLAGWQKSLTTNGLSFEHLKIDLEAENKIQLGSISPYSANLQFLNFGSDLVSAGLNLLDGEAFSLMELSPLPNVKQYGIGFELNLAPAILGIVSPAVQFSIIIHEDNSIANEPTFSFGGLNIIQMENIFIEDLSVDCGNNMSPILIDENPVLHAGTVEGSFTTLEVGYFTLQPSFPLIQDANGVISGTGTIDVPIFGPFRTLNVEFVSAKVDENGRIVAGQIYANEGGEVLFDSTDTEVVMNLVQGQVDDMVANANAAFNLPIVMGMEAGGNTERDQGLIVMGLAFGPQEAKVQAKIIIDTGNKNYIEFSAEGLNLVPNGIASYDVNIGLTEDFSFQPIDALQPLTFKKYVPNTGEGSFVACDCNGFAQFQLEGSYEFADDQLLALDDQGGPNGTVVADFTFKTTTWGQFTGKLSGLGDFTFPGLQDYFSMSASDVFLDFSTLENEPESIEFPENYYDPTLEDDILAWRGIYMPEFTITLPGSTFLSESGRSPSLICENLLFDRQGVTFSLFGKNLLDGNLNGWGFSLDSLGISVLTNTLESSGLSGTVNMPLLDEALIYTGEMLKDDEGFWYMNLFPENEATIQIDPMYSYIQLSPSSSITLATVPDPDRPGRRKFKPYADLYGKIGMDITREEFMASGDTEITDAISSLENTLGAQFDFEPPAISLYGLKINHPDLEPGKTFGLDYYEVDGGISIGSFELSFKQLQLLEKEISVKNKTYPGVGLQFRLSVPLVTFNMAVWAKKDTITDKYSFGKFEFDIKTAKFECNPNPDSVALFIVEGDFVNVPFLDTTFPVVANQQGSYTTVDGQGQGFVSFPISLKKTLEDLGNKLPFDIGETFANAGFDLGGTVPDFNITGITFFDNGTAVMTANLNLEIGGSPLPFVASMPIHPDGIFFNEVKLGLGKDLGF